MPTHVREQSDATQIIKEILKDAAKPRQSVSVREACEKKNPAPIAPERWVGTRAGKLEPPKPAYQGKVVSILDRAITTFPLCVRSFLRDVLRGIFTLLHPRHHEGISQAGLRRTF